LSEISLAEAEGKLADLVERVRQGETIDLTEEGRTVARLTPAAPVRELEPVDVERLRALTASMPFDPEPVETWIRKFRDDARY
jgi:prevent-host-death family protein